MAPPKPHRVEPCLGSMPGTLARSPSSALVVGADNGQLLLQVKLLGGVLFRGPPKW